MPAGEVKLEREEGWEGVYGKGMVFYLSLKQPAPCSPNKGGKWWSAPETLSSVSRIYSGQHSYGNRRQQLLLTLGHNC